MANYPISYIPYASITQEIREIRHQLAAKQGNDVHRIGEELRRRQMDSGRRVVRLPKREPEVPSSNHRVDGDPIKDTFVDDDGLPIDLDPTVDTTLDKERKIIEAAGYEWDETIPGWKVPDGHVWDDVQKKWVHA